MLDVLTWLIALLIALCLLASSCMCVCVCLCVSVCVCVCECVHAYSHVHNLSSHLMLPFLPSQTAGGWAGKGQPL